ncbi:MAG: helix-turn-helix domain-containing protein, partial [Sphingomonas sp.]
VAADGTALGAPKPLADSVSAAAFVGRTVDDVERDLILHTLEHCGGNRTSASTILGISVRTMRNKLRTFIEAGIPVQPAH